MSNVELARAERFAGTIDARADDSIAVRRRRSAPGSPSIEPPGATVLLDERHVCRAPADRFDSDRSRSRIAVEHPRAGDPRREDVEQRLAQPVGRRTQPVPVGSPEPPAFQRAGDDTHAILPPFRRPLPDLDQTGTAPPSVCSSGGRRALASGLLARRTIATPRAAPRSKSIPVADEIDQCGTSARPPAACRRSRPGRAARRSRSAISNPSVVSVIAFSRSRASSDSGDW